MWIPKADLEKLGNVLRSSENGEKLNDENLQFLKKWASKGHKLCDLHYSKQLSLKN
jgi:hypothetical protein